MAASSSSRSAGQLRQAIAASSSRGGGPLVCNFVGGADEPGAGGPFQDLFDCDAPWSHGTATSVDTFAHLLDYLTNDVVSCRPLG